VQGKAMHGYCSKSTFKMCTPLCVFLEVHRAKGWG
jgi:hypothetical protein